MGPVPLERLSPYHSKESKNVPIGCVCDLGISFNVDSSWTNGTLDIELVSVILVESDFRLYGTNVIGKFVSSSFCAYVERPNPISYTSCMSI
jgi:hypothetical protein